jgi:alpha-mannosidase
VLDDLSDTWSHGVVRYDKVIGEFAVCSVERVEDGPVRSVVRVESQYGRSRLTQDFIMYRALDQIEVRVTVDWHEHLKMLKLNFPLNLFYTTATFEVPYGSIQRPANGAEVPGQSWVDLTGIGRNNGNRFGMSILNDGKYSFDMTEHEINLTVLRSPIYAHHVPYEPQPGGQYSFMDQGVQRFTYALLPHTGSWEDAGTVQRAAELNQPPILQVESLHAGPLPQKDSYLSVDQDNVIVTALKRAEDNDDLVLRCYETSRSPTEVTIRLPRWNRVIRASFKPGEIKTFCIPADESMPARETNLLEWDES